MTHSTDYKGRSISNVNHIQKNNLFYVLDIISGMLTSLHNNLSTINVLVTLFWLLGNTYVVICSHVNVRNGQKHAE